MITLKNNSKTTLVHDNYRLEPNKVIDVPDKIGRIWLMVAGIVEFKDPAEAKAEVAKLQAENEEMKKEVEKLKKTVETKQTKTKNTKKGK